MTRTATASFVIATAILCHVVASRAIFYQDICEDSGCSNCQESELPQNECVLTTNGGSAVSYCSAYYLQQSVFMFTQNCTLYSYSQKAPLNTCLNGETLYVEYACPDGSPRMKSKSSATARSLATSQVPTIVPLEGLRQFGLSNREIKLRPSWMFPLSSFQEEGAVVVSMDDGSSMKITRPIKSHEVAILTKLAKSVSGAPLSALHYDAMSSSIVELHELNHESIFVHVDTKEMRLVVVVPPAIVSALRRNNSGARGASLSRLLTLQLTGTSDELLTLKL